MKILLSNNIVLSYICLKDFKKYFYRDDDVELLVHDSEVVKKVTYKCKLLQFHMDDSPYYGTWTKKATNVGPRTPFKLIRYKVHIIHIVKLQQNF